MHQKAPQLEPGDEWSALLADFSPLCQNSAEAPCQLNRVWAFCGKALPRAKARAYLGPGAVPEARCTTRWGCVPTQTLPTAIRGWPRWSQAGCHRSRMQVTAVWLGRWMGRLRRPWKGDSPFEL